MASLYCEDMPLFKSGRDADNERRKLERKLYLAQENPDEVFDLSECGIKHVPAGVFSKCRVFRKTSLILHSNKIASLEGGGSLKDLAEVEDLDLHSNNLRVLPQDIGELKCLRILDVSGNALKTIPDSVESLTCLEVLNVSSNKFKEFPTAILKLKKLRVLDISNNEIRKLPVEFHKLSRLKSLRLDCEKFVFPDSTVCNGTVEMIMRFLCDHCGVEYLPCGDEDTDEPDACLTREPVADTCVDTQFEQFQSRKERRHLEMLAMEAQLQEAHVANTHLAEDAVEKRRLLLLEMAREQDELHDAILEIQNQKDIERQKLLSLLSQLESHAAALIKEIASSVRTETSERLREALRVERLDMEELYNLKYKRLDATQREEILSSMVDMLHHSDLQILSKNNEHKKHLLEGLKESDAATTRLLDDIISAREKDKQDLAQHIQREEAYQKNAFEALQLRNDRVHSHISQQIQLIEKELSKLTEVERKKRDLKVTTELDGISHQRTELAFLLAKLLDSKAVREKELHDYIREMDSRRDAEIRDFWLLQYQKLLDRKPQRIEAMEQQLDPRIVSVLMNVHAEHYITLFAAQNVSWDQFISMGLEDFRRLGILSHDIASAVMAAVSSCARTAEEEIQEKVPSAPPFEQQETPHQMKQQSSLEVRLWHSSECVICLDVQTLIVFLPCGHVCCCQGCGEGILQCPLCRVDIESRLSLLR